MSNKKGRYVLDVGCDIVVTSCYIAKTFGCKVVGIDVSERIIDRSNGRAKREGVEDRVEFRVEDTQSLPFEDNLFDAVIGEFIIAFVEDK
ncbi:MAG: methyltransferase domain-containing protein [archaeon]|nr:methyltransferase domain-containing protein [archaeon]MCP8306416.1 methyltransferase domain-containing protein [archaeon]